MPLIRRGGALDLLALHRADPRRYPYLLETRGEDGWDILFACPQGNCLSPQPFLDGLDAAWRAENCLPEDDDPRIPFRGGWFLYLSYELLGEIEPAVGCHPLPPSLPAACFTRIPSAILVDRKSSLTYFFAESAYSWTLEQLVADADATPSAEWAKPVISALTEAPASEYLAGVRKIQQYIREGDVFQVNLAREWRAQLAPGTDAGQIYRSLRAHNAAPFGGIVHLGDEYQVICSSPERLVRIDKGRVTTRPIAGTRPRAQTPEEDDILRTELLVTEKERAEHIMLVDLERNDLGRICKPGSVEVDPLMQLCSYAHVHHIESTVKGELRKDVSPGEVIKALFPGGTITGCPKVRTMQIIHELESSARGPYTGSMGYLNRDGSLDLNILIRSMVLSGGCLSFKTGAGIVADSNPEAELAETRAKAKGLLRAIGAIA